MSQSTIEPVIRRRPRSVDVPARAYDLDALASLDVRALGELYRTAPVPTSVDRLAGHPTGRMLAVRHLDAGLRGALVHRVAGAALFPWGGKSFQGEGTAGNGTNRVHIGGRHQLFPFHTRVMASVIDGRPCVALDYDRPDNPAFIRAIHDEVREVDDGLFLGPAMWKTSRAPALVLWFALDTRLQAPAIGAV